MEEDRVARLEKAHRRILLADALIADLERQRRRSERLLQPRIPVRRLVEEDEEVAALLPVFTQPRRLLAQLVARAERAHVEDDVGEEREVVGGQLVGCDRLAGNAERRERERGAPVLT